MQMFLQVAGLLLGFAMLIKGADVFVGASVNIAKRLRVPNIVIGLTIVALGTSAPEAVISVSAAISGSNAMAIGNVVGSNIMNLLLVIGLCALIKPIAITVRSIARDYWLSVGAAAAVVVMKLVFTDTIPRAAAAALLLVFVIYMVVLIRNALKNRCPSEEENAGEEPLKKAPQKLSRSIILAVLGTASIVAGGQFTVNSAVSLADMMGISERIVGLTVLAIGTSLPELVTTAVAAKRGENDIAVGNIIGSNIFNLLMVLGLSGVIVPLTVDMNLLTDFGVLIAGSLAFLLFAYTGRRLVRREGLAMMLMYAAYMVFLIVF